MSVFWALPGALIWLVVLWAPWRPWSTRERFSHHSSEVADADLSDVVVLIPARNELAHLPQTLAALEAQGSGLKVVVVDDESSDGTGPFVARWPGIVSISGSPPPSGWTGKLWAQEQGRRELDRTYTLLLDADIVLRPGFVAALRTVLDTHRSALVSVMVELPLEHLWEKLLLPAFVFFFKLLYPFRLVNDPRSPVAAAAGGCIFLETRVLEGIGGFAPIRGALIDDCALAMRAKRKGYRLWLGLTRAAYTTRRYARLADVWNMVARTAFTQLRYSALLLMVCTGLMLAAFVAPWAALLAGRSATLLAGLALAIMFSCYLPTVRYYDLRGWWVLGLPVAAALFLAMTWASALRYWRDGRAMWRGRGFEPEPSHDETSRRRASR